MLGLKYWHQGIYHVIIQKKCQLFLVRKQHPITSYFLKPLDYLEMLKSIRECVERHCGPELTLSLPLCPLSLSLSLSYTHKHTHTHNLVYNWHSWVKVASGKKIEEMHPSGWVKPSDREQLRNKPSQRGKSSAMSVPQHWKSRKDRILPQAEGANDEQTSDSLKQREQPRTEHSR